MRRTAITSPPSSSAGDVEFLVDLETTHGTCILSSCEVLSTEPGMLLSDLSRVDVSSSNLKSKQACSLLYSCFLMFIPMNNARQHHAATLGLGLSLRRTSPA